MVLFSLTLMLLFLLLIGYRESLLHQRALAQLPVRIHINGSRGKSSVTRLVAAGLRAGGLKTLAKTTGSAPRVIDENGNDKVIHRLRSASIGEQVKLIRAFARQKPDVVVFECMAVMPQYQWVAEHKMVRSTIGVITNVRPDHIDEMGPRMEDICNSLGNTVPYGGIMVTSEHTHAGQLSEIARDRNTDFFEVTDEKITDAYMNRFPYLEHAENVALALKVCTLAGVEEKTALEGMISAKPDPGALVLWNLQFGENKNQFVSAFAANDPESTTKIWRLVAGKAEGRKVCVFLNARPDRRSRTRQMFDLISDEIKPELTIIRGENLPGNLAQLTEEPGMEVKLFPWSATTDDVLDFLKELDDQFIFGIGNIVGWGDEFVHKLKGYRVNG
ncbi:MAG: poly-gamma-glutamate synthase PgsB [FCB group bacterium]|nr:poly-gamma-glutamate synthase PgsB [FCB group bacterium]